MALKRRIGRLKDRFRDLVHSLRRHQGPRNFITDPIALHERLQDALRASRPPDTEPDDLAANLLDEKLRKITGAQLG